MDFGGSEANSQHVERNVPALLKIKVTFTTAGILRLTAHANPTRSYYESEVPAPNMCPDVVCCAQELMRGLGITAYHNSTRNSDSNRNRNKNCVAYALPQTTIEPHLGALDREGQ